MGGRKSTDIDWQKSSYSGTGDCVEVALIPGGVLVRDSKERDGSILHIPISAWRVVLSIIK